MKKILTKLLFGFGVIGLLITCAQETFNPPKNEQEENGTNVVIRSINEDTNLYTVTRIKEMIHQAVLESPTYSFNEEKNADIITYENSNYIR